MSDNLTVIIPKSVGIRSKAWYYIAIGSGNPWQETLDFFNHINGWGGTSKEMSKDNTSLLVVEEEDVVRHEMNPDYVVQLK